MAHNQQRDGNPHNGLRGKTIAADSVEIEQDTASTKDGKVVRKQVCRSAPFF